MIRPALIAIAVAGCGRVEFDPLRDAGGADISDSSDGSTTPCAVTPWGNIVHLVALSSASNEYSPALHPGGLVLVFESTRTASSDLYVSTRATTSDAFGAPVAIAALNTGVAEFGAQWSADGNTLYFTRMGTGDLASTYSGGTSFGAPTSANLPSDGDSWELTADGSEAFYTAVTTSDDVAHATLGATNLWIRDDSVTAALNTSLNEGYPGLDDARQELYYEGEAAGHLAIFVATRSGPHATFGPGVLVPELEEVNTNAVDPELSPDGLTMVFAGTRSDTLGVNDLYVATRTCQ